MENHLCQETCPPDRSRNCTDRLTVNCTIGTPVTLVDSLHFVFQPDSVVSKAPARQTSTVRRTTVTDGRRQAVTTAAAAKLTVRGQETGTTSVAATGDLPVAPPAENASKESSSGAAETESLCVVGYCLEGGTCFVGHNKISSCQYVT